MKKVLSLFIGLVFAMAVLAACEDKPEVHTHTFGTDWLTSDAEHWHAATCEHADEVSDKGAHVDDDGNDLCDVCSYVLSHTHTFATEWTKGETTHYYKATCKHTEMKKDEAEHADADNNGRCDVCDYDYGHEHAYADVWTAVDDDYHWHAPTCGHTVDGIDKAAHVDADKNGSCDDCANQTELLNFNVTVKAPDMATVTDPEGKESSTFVVVQGTTVECNVILPRYYTILSTTGAEIVGEPEKIKDTEKHAYTLKISGLTADTEITMEVNKNSNVDVIVENGEHEMVFEKNMMTKGELTFAVPSAGRYIIYSPTHPGSLMGIAFSTQNDNPIEQSSESISYAFDVAEAGEITLNYSYFSFDAKAGTKETFKYVVSRIDPELTLTSLTGTGYLMPANALVSITFTVPAPGRYQLTSSAAAAWNGDVTQPHVFHVGEGELTQTITMHYNIAEVSTFLFDWVIKPVGGEPIKAEIGANEVTAPKGDYQAITFTPAISGDYCFTVNDPGIFLGQWTVEEWGSEHMGECFMPYVLKGAEAGKTYTFFLHTNPYNDDIEGDIVGVLNIEYVPVANGNNEYTAQVGMNNAFYNDSYSDAEYCFTMPAGTQISFDGGKTWVDTHTILIPAQSALSFQIKADGKESVNFSIIRMVYEYELVVGENTVTLIPGKEYDITLTGSISGEHYVTYFLSWADANITVSYAGQTLSSGDIIENYANGSSSLTVVYHGTEKAEITFTLENGSTLSGDFVVQYYDDEYEDFENLYELTFTPSGPNAISGILTLVDQYYDEISGTYHYTIVGQTVSLTNEDGEDPGISIYANERGILMIQGPNDKIPRPLDKLGDDDEGGSGITPSDNIVVLGDNAIELSAMETAVLIFTATQAGEYRLSLAQNESNGLLGIETDNEMEWTADAQTFTLAVGESFTFIVAADNNEADTINLVLDKID